MNLNDVLTLAKSGFTATQISALMALQAPVAQAPVAQAPVAQAPVAQAPVAPVAPVAQQAPQQTPNNDPIMAEIQKLTQAMQSNAIMNTSLPTPQSTEDILAQIINPKEVTK